MEDVNISKYRASVVREGSTPASPGFAVSEGQNPVDPSGSGQNHLPVTIATAATGLSITESQVLGGAGTVGQYIRGDGSLADFPESSGGGSSVSYYLNGSVSQGTIGGVAYKELNKVPVLGAGTDFTINANGYIASFLTDAGDPNLLEIPAGNWNFETFFSANSGGGSPTFYVELYKYNGTTFTLLASNSTFPELIAFGTNVTAYFSTLAVPTTTLALTDRLAIRYYVTHSGRTITLHTEDNHLCQIVTTFTTGITALNGLTAQVQNFAVGTSGTDFAIASATATHTFNLPTASALNRGALSSADWSIFNGKQNALTNPVTGTGASGQVAFWNGTTSQTGDNGLFWDNTNKRLGVGTTTPDNKFHVFSGVAGEVAQFTGAIENRGLSIRSETNISASALVVFNSQSGSNQGTFSFETDTIERWRITSTGILQSNGAQTIQTSTGNLTLATAAGNGNILLTPNGTGVVFSNNNVGIGVASTLASSGPILTTTLTNGGSGYVDNTYVDVTVTSIVSNGILALFTIVVSGGIVTTATLTWSGVGYKVGDTLTVSNTLLGGTGSGLIITVNTVDSSQLTIAGAQGGDITLFRSDTSITLNENIGSIKWSGNDTTLKASGIYAEIGAFSAGSVGGAYLSFSNSTGSGGLLTERWRITPIGILQSNGAQTIQTSTGNLTLTSADNTGIVDIRRTDRALGAELRLTNSFNGLGWLVGDIIGTLNFYSPETSTTQPIRSQIQAISSFGATYAQAMNLTFSTANGNTLTEGFRLNYLGNLLIGTTTDNGQRLQVTGTILTEGSSNGIFLRNGFTSEIVNPNFNTRDIQFNQDTVGTVVFKANGNVLIGTTTNGASKLRIVGLPTSAVGLSSGDVYNLAGTLMIV